MNDFTRRLEKAREKVAVDWTEERQRSVEVAMRARRDRRRMRARVLAGAASAMVVAAVVGMAWPRAHTPAPVAQTSPAVAPDRTVRLDDGSTIAAQGDTAAVVLRHVSAEHVDLDLSGGTARLDIVPRADRVVRLDARVAAVETSGGVVTVALEGEHARVSVEQGRARILWGIEETWLKEGERGEFPRAQGVAPSPPESTTEETSPSAPPTVSVKPVASAPQGPVTSWRAQAHDGDYEGAFRALQAAGPTNVRDEPADLLLAADVARLSHHPSDAVTPLERVVREHAGDPRAPLAAFTLGRVLLDELGRPAEAASAFSRAQALGPGGPLEEDALAREVEAWSRAGDANRAHAAAERYVSRYPDGRRLRAVKKFGELD
ncbi:MAG TPA: tetratricopeptide repeat protein [Polyangiaceae bacterium]|jgi:transmembrane sensor